MTPNTPLTIAIVQMLRFITQTNPTSQDDWNRFNRQYLQLVILFYLRHYPPGDEPVPMDVITTIEESFAPQFGLEVPIKSEALHNGLRACVALARQLTILQHALFDTSFPLGELSDDLDALSFFVRSLCKVSLTELFRVTPEDVSTINAWLPLIPPLYRISVNPFNFYPLPKQYNDLILDKVSPSFTSHFTSPSATV